MWAALLYLLHFQHESGRISFKIIIHTYSRENLISDTKRRILSRYVRAWKIYARALLQKVKAALCSFALTGLIRVKRFCC